MTRDNPVTLAISPSYQFRTNVSVLAGRFGASFGAREHARQVGTLHDAGKYSPAAQKRMADPERMLQGTVLCVEGRFFICL